jgi:hypothetical protein
MQVTRFELYIKYTNETGVVQVILTDDSGRTVDPISLLVDSEFVMSFSELFSQSQQQTITTLTAEKETLLNSNQVLVSDKQVLESQVDLLSITIDNLTAEVKSLQPYNKRWIDPEKFVARFTPALTRAVYTSTDATLIGGRELLDLYIAENYQIVLDDPQVTGLLAYMVSVGLLTDPEKENILRDSSSSERYVPTVTE